MFTNVLTIFGDCKNIFLFGEICDKCNVSATFILINKIIGALTVVIAILVMIGIIWGGVSYATSNNDPNRQAKAMRRIKLVSIGFAIYSFIYVFLELVLPGGFINTALTSNGETCASDSNTDIIRPAELDSKTPDQDTTQTNRPITPLTGDSDTIPCDPRTEFVRKETNAHINGIRISINVCRVPNIAGENLVNSRVSGAYYAMAEKYKADHGGELIKATTALRTFEQQAAAWNMYESGGKQVAKPGFSKHESGLAVDFVIPDGDKSYPRIFTCDSTPLYNGVKDSSKIISRWYYTEISDWFCNNLDTFGLSRTISTDPGHVSPSTK